jgi:hypothetical protein
MVRKYSKRASEKVARTMHEFKRGKLKSGSGRKVTSRKQAVAIGISQARRVGYKVPTMHGHATKRSDVDAQVRDYLINMQPGSEIDARGIARALGGVDPLAADYALERAEKQGLAVTSDGRWFGPVKKPAAQIKREIAQALSRPVPETIKLKDRYSRDYVWLVIRDGRVVGVTGADPSRYMGMTLDEAKHYARYGGTVAG